MCRNVESAYCGTNHVGNNTGKPEIYILQYRTCPISTGNITNKSRGNESNHNVPYY